MVTSPPIFLVHEFVAPGGCAEKISLPGTISGEVSFLKEKLNAF
jgi:hypothetical protein